MIVVIPFSYYVVCISIVSRIHMSSLYNCYLKNETDQVRTTLLFSLYDREFNII